MSHVLTETVSFDPSCTVPDILDTDYPTTVPLAYQALANRTQFLLDQVNQGIARDNTINARDDGQDAALSLLNSRAFFSVGSGTPGGLWALTAQYDGSTSGSYSLSSNRVHVPFAGKYVIIATLYLRYTKNTVNPNLVGANLYLGETVLRQGFASVPDVDGAYAQIKFHEYVQITSASSQLINLRPVFTTANISAGAASPTSTLDIQRLT